LVPTGALQGRCHFRRGTEVAVAAKQATATIPIVFPTADDPVGSKLVASLARPGGNINGLSNQAVDLAAKRLEILREVFLQGLPVWPSCLTRHTRAALWN